jgi:acetyl esterase/lipase
VPQVVGESYASSDGTQLLFDVFLPPATPVHAALICIHGGGWISGEREDVHEVARWFAEQGYAAFCPEYRLAPLHPYPAAVDDCRAFVRHLRANADDLGIEPGKIASIGNSAGGYLSTMLAVTDDAVGHVSSRVNVAADICGLTDLTHPADQHPMIAWDFIGQFVGVPFEGNESTWASASPLLHVSAAAAPVTIFHGEADDIVWPAQSRRLHESLAASGVRCEIDVIPSEGHSFSHDAFIHIMRSSERFFREVLA